jgi:hypothetical protein
VRLGGGSATTIREGEEAHIPVLAGVSCRIQVGGVQVSQARALSEDEIEESIRFADGALAAAGHFVDRPESDRDIRQALRDEITSEELVRGTVARAFR